MADDKVAALEAKHGEKMIEVKVRFWTNDISSEHGKVVPKHAWTSGVVRITPNKAHGLESSYATLFHSLLDVSAAIEKVLIEHRIVLHRSKQMKKYMSGD
jgi:hypothetical protein